MQIVLKSIEQKKNHNSTWRYTREIQITESSSGRNKNQEIADELGISEGTSKSNLFKAKAKIKQYLINLNKKRED